MKNYQSEIEKCDLEKEALEVEINNLKDRTRYFK